MQPPEIFDRNARHMQRDRSVGANSFLAGRMVEILVERLDGVQREFASALVIGAEPALIAMLESRGCRAYVREAAPRRALRAGARRAEEDRIAAGDAAYDLVVSANCLDTVADLPGVLVQCRRALRSDGLFLACFFGAPSLPALRRAVATADGDSPVARFHPQIDVRAAGDLLVRAGFALPVADLETLTIAYSSFGRLIGDLRDAAATNVLRDRRSVNRGWLARAAEAFGGQPKETIGLVVLTGWAPDASQPKPARRGSATASLAAALAKPAPRASR
ncbi:MAG: methyltransferase domain-containing protein [Sphingomonadaceae bacterium]|nr:methyltransferase domain-containing protein [Sphingomonadaceae bacterium]